MSAPRLHGLLLDAAEKRPDHPAHVRGQAVVSYDQLATRAAALAHGLRELGVRRGDRVALVMDRRVEYLVAHYAILMAGAAVVPLSNDTRPANLRHALSHSGARAVVLDAPVLRHLAPVIADLPGLVAAVTVGGGRLEEAPATLQQASYEALSTAPRACWDAGAGGEDLASVTYTSGTTGPPKGVMLAHRNIAANIRSIVQYLGLGPEDRVAMVLPYYYVYGSSVLHTHVAAGGTVIDAGSIAFPTTVLDAMERHRCTGLSGVPSTFVQLLRAPDLAGRDLSPLRYVTQAGAPMTRSLTERLRSAFPGAKIVVMYGQTEASARLTYLPPERLDDKLGSAGVGIPGVTLAIVDAEGREVPRGTVGEVTARGDNVMLGYLDDPVATARALRGGALHTGDLGWMDDEGFLHLVGRAGDMIKSGGHRVGPQEVEEVVAAVAGVAECAVAGVPDELLGQAIVAFVVREPGASLGEEEVLRACVRGLPKRSTPARVLFVDALPRSDRGKILRSVLAAGWNGGAVQQERTTCALDAPGPVRSSAARG